MFKHPLCFLGAFVSGGGWLFLTVGVGVGGTFGTTRLVNFHAVSIAENVILLGYTMIFAGIIVNGFEGLQRHLGATGSRDDDDDSDNAGSTGSKKSPADIQDEVMTRVQFP